MLDETLLLLRDDANLFVEEILNAAPDDWQVKVLNALASSPRVAVRSGHG